MIVTMTDVMIRFFMILLVVCVCCSYAESFLQYILPTDHLSNNVSCPQYDHDCRTLNEWINSDFIMDEISSNEIYTVALLPGIHVINTT